MSIPMNIPLSVDGGVSIPLQVGEAVVTEPIVDPTLTISGAAADAKVTGDAIDELKSAIDLGSITPEVKTALLACFENVAWINNDGQDYVDALHDALYNRYWEVTNNLTNCTTSNESVQTIKGAAYTATITASTGYVMTGATVSIAMGGNDITSTAYSNGVISIPAVTGALVITISAAAKTVSSISAVYTQSGTVYDTDSIDSLKDDLVVTATYTDSSTATVPAADYTLSGSLAEGTSIITVSYGGKTTTFTVLVTAYWDYEWDYSMGKLEEQTGWELSKSSSGASTSLTATAERFTSDGATKYLQPHITTGGSLSALMYMTNGLGVIQITFVGHLNSSVANTLDLMAVENDTNRVRVFAHAGKWKIRDYSAAANCTAIGNYSNDTEYTCKLVCKGTKADFYVNGTVMASDISMSLSVSGTQNCIIFNGGGSSYYADLKSLKLKVGSY